MWIRTRRGTGRESALSSPAGHQNPRTNLRQLQHCADLDTIAALAACEGCSITVRADTGALMASLSVVTCNWSESSAWHADIRAHRHPHRWPAVSAAGRESGAGGGLSGRYCGQLADGLAGLGDDSQRRPLGCDA